ncbi:MAG: acyltransferase, partial [Candidatus Omnitrophota bacterium]|nr:acyltransferase [Candidatus Omnitrophota bacterium]
VSGLLLLTGFAAPVALVVLAPVTLHIILFHLFLTPGAGNIVLPLMMGIAHIVAMSGYWNLYKPLFGKK